MGSLISSPNTNELSCELKFCKPALVALTSDPSHPLSSKSTNKFKTWATVETSKSKLPICDIVSFMMINYCHCNYKLCIV